MAKIRVDVPYVIVDGSEVLFYAPCNFADVTNLIVYYPNAEAKEESKEFVFCDAEGNDLTNLESLFAEGVCVKVILSVTKSIAFIQNGATNAYLEEKFKTKLDKSGGKMTGAIHFESNGEPDTKDYYAISKDRTSVFGDTTHKHTITFGSASYDGSATIEHKTDGIVDGRFEVYAGGIRFRKGAENSNSFEIVHEGNLSQYKSKVGTYNGIASSTARTISINGVGNVLLIESKNLYGLVAKSGGVVFVVDTDGDCNGLNATPYKYSSQYLKFEDGVLTIYHKNTEANNKMLDLSGYTYTYYVL